MHDDAMDEDEEEEDSEDEDEDAEGDDEEEDLEVRRRVIRLCLRVFSLARLALTIFCRRTA
jgi:hypothetical protein